MTIPRQLAPTVGPAHGGFEFLKGNFEGLKGYAVGRMTKSRRGKLYIDDEDWGPEACSIECGYWVPFDEGKSLRLVWCGISWASMTRERIRFACVSSCCFLS